jgi:O-antigen ligase
MFVKDKKVEKFLLVTLFFTFSMGYFMQAAAYIIMFTLSNLKNKERFFYLFIAGAILIGVYSTRGTSNSKIYDMSIGRIEMMFEAENELSSMEGTSREELVENSKLAFMRDPVWGIGWPNDGTDINTGDNYYETLAHDGIVGTIYQYFPYILLLIWGGIRRDKETICVILFLALAIFHRPIHPNMLTYFIYYSLPIMYSLKVKEENAAKRNVRFPSV